MKKKREPYNFAPVNQRKCWMCKVVKPKEDYYKDKGSPSGFAYTCKECVLIISRTQKHRKEWNRTHRDVLNKTTVEYMKRNPEKKKAWSIWGKARSSGKIPKQPCVVCGSTEVQGHHKDYSKPLEVVWLCRRHHKDAHAGRVQV